MPVDIARYAKMQFTGLIKHVSSERLTLLRHCERRNLGLTLQCLLMQAGVR
jgi:hypothetical protein